MTRKAPIGQNNWPNLHEFVKSSLEKCSKGQTILDAGAGELKYKPYCNHLNYISQDFCQYDGTGDGKGSQENQWDTSKIDIVSDIINIPLESSSVDIILCSEVFEHIPNPVLAIKEFSRLLKPGGKLILTAPFCSSTHFSPFFYSTGFSKYYYEYHLKEFNLSVESIKFNGGFFEVLASDLRSIGSLAMKYSNYKINFLNKFLINQLVNLLDKIEKKDKGSNEYKSHGLFILATKVE
jgi:ubiquinone/menaquinone biosynthesis C-methylase UbiE